jgi:hypothetical protein
VLLNGKTVRGKINVFRVIDMTIDIRVAVTDRFFIRDFCVCKRLDFSQPEIRHGPFFKKRWVLDGN